MLATHAGDEVGALCSVDGATVLFATSAPVRFLPGGGNGDAACVVHAADFAWVVQEDGLVVKTYDTPSSVSTRLVFAAHVAPTAWTCRAGWSERLILEGEWREHVTTEDQSAVSVAAAGMYISRPAGTPFDGPGSGASATAVFLDRTIGEVISTS